MNNRKPIHFSNRVAEKLGYCAFVCLSADLGSDKALQMLQNEGNTRNEERK